MNIKRVLRIARRDLTDSARWSIRSRAPMSEDTRFLFVPCRWSGDVLKASPECQVVSSARTNIFTWEPPDAQRHSRNAFRNAGSRTSVSICACNAPEIQTSSTEGWDFYEVFQNYGCLKTELVSSTCKEQQESSSKRAVAKCLLSVINSFF